MDTWENLYSLEIVSHIQELGPQDMITECKWSEPT